MKLILFLSFFLINESLKSQDISFKQYISNFKHVKLPININQEMVLKAAKNNDLIKEEVISKFISAKFYPNEANVYLHHYFGCFAKNDSIVEVIYLKTAIVQGENYTVEIALYNSKTERLIEKMLISTYSNSEEGGEKFSASKIEKDLSILTTKGHCQTTANGFKLLNGQKMEATDW